MFAINRRERLKQKTMKTLEIKNVLKADLLLVEVPDVYEIIHHDNGVIAVLDSVVQWEIKGSYTLLGKPDEISEEDAREFVRKMRFSFSDRHLDYTPYIYSPNYYKTAKEYLLSAIEKQVYWENPIKKPNGEDYYYEENHGFDGVETLWDGGSYNEDLGQFDKAESRTFDRNRTLIFKKN